MNIINIEHISKVYGEKVIFDDASYGIQEGDKIGIIGINGTGKTTLLNMIAGREETDSGSIIRQNGLHMAYLSQNPVYEKEDTVLSFVTRGIDPSDRTAISEAKSNLMTLGLADYEEKLEHLSGGQRKKAALARVLLGSFDVLLLDEPTNHMDIVGKEALEQMLKGYQGTLVFVSHDRYFVRQVADKILSFDGGVTTYYPFGYEQYEEATADKDDQISFGKYAAVSPAAKLAIEQEKNKTAASASPKTLYANPGKERSRLSAKVKKAEAAVEACEEVLSKLQDELNDPAIAASYSKLQEAQKKVDAKEEELNGLMEVWEQASAELDAFEESLKG